MNGGGGGGGASCRAAGDLSTYGIFPSRKRSPSAGSHEMIVNGLELGKHVYLLSMETRMGGGSSRCARVIEAALVIVIFIGVSLAVWSWRRWCWSRIHPIATNTHQSLGSFGRGHFCDALPPFGQGAAVQQQGEQKILQALVR